MILKTLILLMQLGKIYMFYSVKNNMVAAPTPPPILGGDLKISEQNNWGDLSKKLNLGKAKFMEGPKILGGWGGGRVGGYEPQ